MTRPVGQPLSFGVLTLASKKLVIVLQECPVGVQQFIDFLLERPVRQLLAVLDLVDRGAVVASVRTNLRLAQLSCLPKGSQRRTELAALRDDGFRFPVRLASRVRSG
jgi:hypothetical protein